MSTYLEHYFNLSVAIYIAHGPPFNVKYLKNYH